MMRINDSEISNTIAYTMFAVGFFCGVVLTSLFVYMFY